MILIIRRTSTTRRREMDAIYSSRQRWLDAIFGTLCT